MAAIAVDGSFKTGRRKRQAENVCSQRMCQFAVTQAFVADGGMWCLVLLLGGRREIGIVRNLMKSRSLLAEGEQQG